VCSLDSHVNVDHTEGFFVIVFSPAVWWKMERMVREGLRGALLVGLLCGSVSFLPPVVEKPSFAIAKSRHVMEGFSLSAKGGAKGEQGRLLVVPPTVSPYIG
jgi:hypothetical protein